MNDRNNRDGFTKGEKIRFGINLVLLLVLAAAALFIWKWPEDRPGENTATGFSAVEEICELATLKCYYHNVAEDEIQPEGPFKWGLFQYGYKKFWMEYDGIVKIGVDVNQVQIQEPTREGIVRIYVPDAKILDISADDSSISNMISDTGVLTSPPNAEEKAKAFAVAQENMRKQAEKDDAILRQARENAKVLLKQYVIHVGEQMGQHYQVEFLDSPLTAS